MGVLIVASSQARVGRSLVAAALAYRIARDGKPVTLARLSGDESAEHDASTFASIEYLSSPGKPIGAGDVASLSGDVVLEAPAGPVKQIAQQLGARVVAVGAPSSPATDASGDTLAGMIVTKVPESEVSAVSARSGLLAVLLEDRLLAAPSIADIAARLNARSLHESGDHASIDRVMLGTVASDAASPYFSNRERKCVITRFDKTDIHYLANLCHNCRACLYACQYAPPHEFAVDVPRAMAEVRVRTYADDGL